MTWNRHLSSLGIVALGLASLAGCQTVKKVTGTHYAHMSATPDRVVEAAEAALQELEFKLVSATGTKLDGRVKARTAQGKDILITVEKEGEDVSKVSVKVGTLGDETISHAILEKTEEKLKD